MPIFFTVYAEFSTVYKGRKRWKNISRHALRARPPPLKRGSRIEWKSPQKTIGSKQKRPGAKGPPEIGPESPLQKGVFGSHIFSKESEGKRTLKICKFWGKALWGPLARPAPFVYFRDKHGNNDPKKKLAYVRVSQTCLGANVPSGLVPSTFF